MSNIEHYAQSCPVGKTMINNKCYDNITDISKNDKCKNPNDVFTEVRDTSNGPWTSAIKKCVPGNIYKDGGGSSPTWHSGYSQMGLTFCPAGTKFLRRPDPKNFNYDMPRDSEYQNGFNMYTPRFNWMRANVGNPHRCVRDTELSDPICGSNTTLQSNGSCLKNDAKPTPPDSCRGGKFLNNECVLEPNQPSCPTNPSTGAALIYDNNLKMCK